MVMHESTEDLKWLQALLDATYREAGAHVTSVHSIEARLSAGDVVRQFQGAHTLVVATVTEGGRPISGPVDAFLFRGRFHFRTVRHAVRNRHLARSRAITGTHVRGDELVVSVHGCAQPLDLAGADAAFAELANDWYGDAQMWDQPIGWAIEPLRMLAADMRVYFARS